MKRFVFTQDSKVVKRIANRFKPSLDDKRESPLSNPDVLPESANPWAAGEGTNDEVRQQMIKVVRRYYLTANELDRALLGFLSQADNDIRTVAKKLGIPPSTAQYHLRNLRKKLHKILKRGNIVEGRK